MEKCKRYIFLFTLLFICLATPGLSASKDEGRMARLTDGARKEGQMVYYTSMDITNAQQLVRAFQEKFPFIKVDIVRTGSEKVLTRVLAEANAKKLKADVIQSSTPHMYAYKQKNLVLKYLSPEAEAFPESAVDPEGYWVSFYENVYVLGYNTKLVSTKEAPKSFDDLLQPRWKGRMAIDSKDARWYGAIDQIWGRKKTMDFMTRLSQQQLAVRTGKTLMIQLLAAGEFDISISAYLDAVGEFKSKGASVEWVYLDPVLVSGHPIFIPTTAPHLNAATLFVDFMLSEKGQEAISLLGKFPPRTTANTEKNLARYYPGIEKRPIPKNKYEIPPEVSERYEEYSTQFRNLFLKGIR
jgi:iron(III) transport system substrate-binding protein